MQKSTSRKKIIVFGLLALLACLSLAIGVFFGSTSQDWSTAEGPFIILNLRLPRGLLALLVGMALSVAGAVFQALLRNPLADPHLLGVSAGGALGVVLGSGFLLTGTLAFSIPVLSSLGSLIAVVIVYRLSLRKGALSIYTLLLIGVMLNSFFVSIIVFLQSLVRADELMTVLFWLLGNLSFANYPRLAVITAILTATLVLLMLQTKKMNILSLGETTAQSLGVSVERTKKIVFILAALLTGMAVSVSGMIGFVGLVVPHLTRLLLGSDYRTLLPASALLGGSVLVCSDVLARLLIAPQELPVGVITSFLGVPFFIYFLKQREAKRVF